MTDSSTSTGVSPASATRSPGPQRRPTAEEVSQFLGRWLGTMHSKPRADTGEPEAWVTTSMERLGYGVIAFLETLDLQNIRITAESASPTDATRQLERAYKSGFMRCAEWADRSDLVADTDSAAYAKDRAADLSALAAEDEASLPDFNPAFMNLPAISAAKQHDLWAEADPGYVEGRKRDSKLCWHLASFSSLMAKALVLSSASTKTVLTQEEEAEFDAYMERRRKAWEGGYRQGPLTLAQMAALPGDSSQPMPALNQTGEAKIASGADAHASAAHESPGLLGIDHLQEAHRLGFLRCAGWAQRDDLISDVDSPAYMKDRDSDVAKVPENVASQHARSV